MSTLLRSLKLMVGADFSQAQAGFKQAAKEFKAVGKDLTNVGSSLTKGVTMPIVGAAIASVKFASDLEESTNKVNVAFGDSADEVKKFADTSLKNFGIAKGSAMDMAATYGDMGTSMGLTTSQAAAMSTSLTGLAGDLASFKNIGLDQASEALRGVFTGEGEALKSLGVVMLDSTLQAYALAQGITTAYKDMSQAEKVALRYKYVMDATRNAQGDFQRTSGGVANQMRTVTESLKEAAASLGTELLPKVASALQSINGLISKFTGLDKSTKNTIITVAGLAAVIGPTILIMGKLSTGLSSVMMAFSAAAKAISSGAGMTGALTALVGPGGIAVIALTALAALTAGIIITKNKMEEGARAAKAMSDAFADSAKAHQDNIKEIRTNATVANQLTGELFALAAKENKSNAEKTKMAGLVAQLNKLVPDLNLSINEQTGELDRNEKAVRDLIAAKKQELQLIAMQDRLVALYKERTTTTDNLAEAQKKLDAIQKKINDNPRAASYFKTEYKYAKEAVDAYSTALDKNQKEIGQTETAFDKMAMSIKSGNEEIVESVKMTAEEQKKANEWAKEMAEGRAKHEKNLLELHRQEVEEIYEQRQKDLEEYQDAVEKATEEHLNQMGGIEQRGIEKTKLTAAQVKKNLEAQIRDFQNWRSEIAKASQRVPRDVMTELQKLGPAATPIIQGLNKMSQKELDAWIATWRTKTALAESAALDEMKSMPGAMTQVGRDAAQGFADGLKSKLDIVKAEAAKLGKVVPYSVRRILEIESPSKVMRGIGEYTSEGMAIGIRDNVGLVKAASMEMSNAAMSTPLQGRAIEPRVTGMESVSQNIMNAVAASGGSGGDVSLVINVGGKTILDTVLTEAQRRNARSGRQVIAVGV